MPCFGPLKGFYSAELNPTGKRSIVFDIKKAYSPVSVPVPCGKCPGCKMEHARQWAMRCMHEARMHKFNCFVTLTYRNADLPEYGDLVRRDTQLFFKRLRKRYGVGIRYYGCGEYGTLNKRPHYHVLLFNHRFPDLKKYSEDKHGILYSSASCDELWKLGDTRVRDGVNFQTAAYCAGYVMDKVTGKLADEHYSVFDADGLIHVRPPEFSLISRGRAIGAGYYERYGSEIRAHDSVIVNGKEVRPPRMYDKLSGLTDPAQLVKIKRRRKRLALLNKADNTSRRRRTKELILLLNIRRKML